MACSGCVTGKRHLSSVSLHPLVHYFNQQQKKAVFGPVCQRRPPATPLQPLPMLSPLWCKCQITFQIRRSGVHLRSLLHILTTHLLCFIPFPSPIVHFLFFFLFLSKVCSRKPQLINFSLLISFSCISCFASLDVLIKIILFRFCFWTSFPLLTGNELRCRRNITRTSAGRLLWGKWHYRQLKGAYERTVGVISETGWKFRFC